MDDFNNNYTPSSHGDDNMVPQQPMAEQQNTMQQPQNTMQQPQNTQAAEPQPAQGQFAQEEPRTPYQTPVQHPAYQAPQQPAGQQYNPQDENGAPQPPKKKRPHGKGVVIALCSVAVACLLFAGGAALGHAFSSDGSAPEDNEQADSGELPTMQLSQTPELDPDNYDVVNGLAGEEIYKKVSPSIVSVLAMNNDGTGGSGSGVIMSEDGYVITNNHVVVNDEGSGARVDNVTVQLSDGTQLPATIVGTDEKTDLAVLKVQTDEKLTAAEFGNSDELQPGEYAYAIGSPGGVELANTITGGRISAINRDITIDDRVMTLIQTDASINPGNSGGALINKFGQVVGITSAKLSSSGFGGTSYEGLGFAIPINTTKTIVDELLQNGYITGRPSIGITGKNVESADGSIRGVQIYSIDSRTKAATEGLQVGDIITAVDGTPTPTMNEVNEVKENKKAGDKLTLTVYRMSVNKSINVTVTLTDEHDLEGDDPNAQPSGGQSSGSSPYGGRDPFSYFFGW
ncbi:MAG: trypsin-like peptidase domain-containing protein [Agathobaculum sp.]|jgi:serine protease Do|uniref:trypsin-like peptidase domain-containing protein n=1 Tax=Agathobaculum sp. TaxID=2048138 RepID=UPI003D938E6F